jgi:flavin-dependent dehydrogenase
MDSKLLKKDLDLFMKKNFPHIKKLSSWIALIPSIQNTKIFNKNLAGKKWILIGDAAGHVNPMFGEGILYALFDGHLSAEAIADGSPIQYDKLWREAYGLNLFSSIKIRKWLYKKPVLELYCQILKSLLVHFH